MDTLYREVRISKNQEILCGVFQLITNMLIIIVSTRNKQMILKGGGYGLIGHLLFPTLKRCFSQRIPGNKVAKGDNII